MAGNRPRLHLGRARPARRSQGQEFDKRGLYPQHVRRLAPLHGGQRRIQRRNAGSLTMLDKTKRAPVLPSAVQDIRPYEQFLVHEARLLDEGFFDEWLALFTDDARYWV